MPHAIRFRAVRIALLALVLAGALLPSRAVRAADPQLDPTCWRREPCEALTGIQAYFESDALACPGTGWGRCYRGKKIPIKVPILGVSEVQDLREYLVLGYRYAIGVAALAAVVIIMIAGIRWMTSGVSDAKKSAMDWIRNAIIGLVLILGSYVLLQTVNPDLVRLSLPRFALIRPVVNAQFCSSVSADEPITTLDGTKVIPREAKNFKCRFEYATPFSAAKTCRGDFCGPGRACVAQGANAYECVDGTVVGEVRGDGNDASLAELPPDRGGNIALDVVCADGRLADIATTSATRVTDKFRVQFAFPADAGIIGRAERACGGSTSNGTVAASTVRGFAILLLVDDTFSPDWYAVGQTGCGGSAKPIHGPTATTPDSTEPAAIAWGAVPPDQLIPQMTILAAVRSENAHPFRCTIALDRSGFPSR